MLIVNGAAITVVGRKKLIFDWCLCTGIRPRSTERLRLTAGLIRDNPLITRSILAQTRYY